MDIVSTPATPICVIDAANFCTTHQGIHPADDGGFAEGFLERQRQLRLAADALDGRPAGCPDWCTIDHAEDDDRDDLDLHMGDDHTDGVVQQLLDVHDGSKLDIRVARTDCLPEGTVGKPTLMIRCDLELTTWEQAAELARTILDGFGYLNGAEKS